jgi:hypothetical protein
MSVKWNFVLKILVKCKSRRRFVKYCLIFHKSNMAPNHVDYVFCSLSICMLCFVVIIRLGGAFCKWDDLVRKERQAKSQAIQIWRLVLWLLVELAFRWTFIEEESWWLSFIEEEKMGLRLKEYK